MPWWSWVLIWAGLVVLLLVVLALAALRVFRKASAAMAELDRLERIREEYAPQAERLVPEFRARASALVRDYDRVVAERDLHIAERDERRELRREARLARARRLIRADPFACIALTDPERR